MCKGVVNSIVWDEYMDDMLDTYIKSSKYNNLISLVATIINNVSKRQSASRSQYMFRVCGEKLKRFIFDFTIMFP